MTVILLQPLTNTFADPPDAPRSERKIDQIEARLANIEGLLRDLSSRNASTADSIRLSHTPQGGANFPSIPTVTASTIGYDSSDEESVFGGDSTLAAQTTFASEFLENAVQRTSLRDVNPRMEDALANLKQLVELQNRQSISHGPRFPLQQPIPPGGLGQLRMPPMDVVVFLLKHIRAAPPSLFTFVCYFVGVTDFSNLCRIVYFPTDDFSDATFTIVNVGLYYMFLEQHSLAIDQATKEEYEPYLQMCRVNVETALANLPLFMSAKVENVKALFLGTIYAIDVSRPSVAWNLTSAAAQLCQTGGFHRLDSSNADPTVFNIKTVLFWNIYTIDKALCLRLGRASMVQDWDISIPRTFNFDGLMGYEVSGVPTMWLKTGTLQGQVYEQLFSPSALARPQAELIERARVLAAECRKIEVEAAECRDRALASLERMKASHLVDIHVKGDEVQLLSTLTLIYRAIPGPDGSISRFCDECVDSARRAVVKHQACMQLVREEAYVKTIYLHWNLLLTPFAPFFVLFCYVIETSSHEDLQLLQDFCTTLGASYGSSETAEKLWRLCHVMCDVATLYVEAKSQQQEDQAMIPIGDEFDMYLSQLGFIPNEDQAAMAASGGPNEATFGNQQVAQMADWFSGSKNLMGLLEQDLSQIGGSEWPQGGPM
ncbi:Fc.00g035330.m01.CDS01 [Cosmosporella sp. VM-42]